MRKYDQGCFVRVTVSRSEVDNFRSTWPCSSLPDRGISFTFDKRNGDLVDMFPYDLDGSDVVALSQDAQQYAGLAN